MKCEDKYDTPEATFSAMTEELLTMCISVELGWQTVYSTQDDLWYFTGKLTFTYPNSSGTH